MGEGWPGSVGLQWKSEKVLYLEWMEQTISTMKNNHPSHDILNLEDLFTRAFFARTGTSSAFHHDLDMDSCLFEKVGPGLVHWTSVTRGGFCTHSPVGYPEA